ncbi:MAG TPA: LURP-one-related family protein [Candidatus Pullichristensenella avicola]|nr:LURP-one-related family protein [Candidatus Pullichristensenella avicola]
MKLVLKEKVFTLKERFNVTDEQEQPLYSVEGKFFSWGHQFDVEDAGGAHVAHIKQKVLALLPRYFITCDGMEEMELKGHLNIIHPHYTLETPDGGWEVRGDFLHHEYTIKKGEEEIATVTKKWFSFGDSYTLDVAEDKNVVPALCVMVALDCIFEDGAAAAAGGAAAAGAYTHHQNNAQNAPEAHTTEE